MGLTRSAVGAGLHDPTRRMRPCDRHDCIGCAARAKLPTPLQKSFPLRSAVSSLSSSSLVSRHGRAGGRGRGTAEPRGAENSREDCVGRPAGLCVPTPAMEHSRSTHTDGHARADSAVRGPFPFLLPSTRPIQGYTDIGLPWSDIRAWCMHVSTSGLS
jgi:hypothetical protein